MTGKLSSRSNSSAEARRGRRMPLPLSILYRPVGEPHWREARLQNVSRSGVLFHTHEALDVSTDLEMSILLDVDPHQRRAGEARLEGSVVRQQEIADQAGMHAVAVSIEHQKLVPADAADRRNRT